MMDGYSQDAMTLAPWVPMNWGPRPLDEELECLSIKDLKRRAVLCNVPLLHISAVVERRELISLIKKAKVPDDQYITGHGKIHFAKKEDLDEDHGLKRKRVDIDKEASESSSSSSSSSSTDSSVRKRKRKMKKILKKQKKAVAAEDAERFKGFGDDVYQGGNLGVSQPLGERDIAAERERSPLPYHAPTTGIVDAGRLSADGKVLHEGAAAAAALLKQGGVGEPSTGPTSTGQELALAKKAPTTTLALRALPAPEPENAAQEGLIAASQMGFDVVPREPAPIPKPINRPLIAGLMPLQNLQGPAVHQNNNANAIVDRLTPGAGFGRVCIEYLCNSKCERGDACPEAHITDPEEEMRVRAKFKEQECRFGKECTRPLCMYRHPGEKMEEVAAVPEGGGVALRVTKDGVKLDFLNV